MTDDSEEHRLTCLARWVVNKYDDTGIRAFLERWKKAHGETSHDKVRQYVVTAYREKR